MRYLKTLLLALLLPACAFAAGWDDNEYKRIEQSIQLPKIAERQFLITSFGAKTTATAAQNQKAINRVISLVSKKGGGKVIIPKGTWNTGAIELKSHVNLVLEEGATLHFAFEPKLYPLVRTSWEGLACWNYSPCIYAYKATDIAITGKGTIDGGGNNDTFWQWNGSPRFGYKEGVTKESQKLGSRSKLLKMAEDGVPFDERKFGMGYGLRPQLVNMVHCERILIKDVKMINSPFWVIHPLLSKNITVDGVYVWNEGPNGDGCDPEACENVLIQNCVFHTGDDCIAIKSGRNNDGRLWNQPSKNIIIRNCKMEDGHGGVVIGSEISGGCENVYAENCVMDSPHLERILRIKTNNCRGGQVQNINMRNVVVGQCKEAVVKINLDYERKEICYRGFEPIVNNVNVENVTCQKSDYGVLIIGRDSLENVYDINIKNCKFDGVVKEPVKITGKTRNVKFDNLVINGSLVLNKEDQPYKNYSEWLTYSEMKRVPHSYLLDFSSKPKWSYVMGIEMEGMLDTYEHYKEGNNAILDYLKEYPAKMIDEKGNITGYKYEDFNLDNVRTAKFILRMHNLFPTKGTEKALKTLFKQLQNQPRTKEGVYWHKAIYANQVWLDGIFMGLPFYCNYAVQTMKPKKAEKYLNDAVDQMVKTDYRTYDEKTQLWKHAWDETHQQFWANKEDGKSQHCWARALGWYVMAMTECLDAMPENYARRQEVIDLLNKAMKSVVKYQDKKTGVWYDVLDVKSDKNYLESTASSMFAYVLLKGYRKGYLSEEYLKAGVKAYNGILKQFIKVNADKTISLTRCCAVSGLGPGPGPYVKKPNYKRDGSFEYYMSEPIRDNDAKGVGPFIWASLEMEQQGLIK
ncbi:glycoside hydrolase family 88 protein [Prevotella copri]|jgi:polygalacturonase/rhamnogalacturonyl hydrolase YesR|uniref:glycoside hydrolase family 88 protein n=1 Tax=Segatella copri TaxID=165179 RepID=UPI001C391BD3|nr:glycoside hydrolase family 88 protein [Segatella copri]MBD9072642.1 glycoside hydrolase [Prevotella sp.]MBV3413197.1 glycoside hydrolase family 88 protein [Segatella copri]